MDSYKLEEIWIYPVKSLGGIRLSSAQVMEKGFQHDRRYMLVDANNDFITQRTWPAMSQFRLTSDDKSFKVNYGQDSIEIHKEPHDNGNFFTASIWDDRVEVAELSAAHSRWFSEKMKMACKLVYFPEKNSRPVDSNYASNNEHVSLADAYPYLIIGQASLNDLNGRLSAQMSMTRFRPNLVFSGGAPFDEDTWSQFKIGDNRFENLKPCARCVMTTIDPETGVQGTEPLATLARFRKKESKVNFGVNLVAVDHNHVKEGDIIQVNSIIESI